MKKLFIHTADNAGIVFFAKDLSVTQSLTFCKIDPSVELSLLLDLLKKEIIYSFEPTETHIRVVFRTKYVDEIL
jgi:hypothetical protein